VPSPPLAPPLAPQVVVPTNNSSSSSSSSAACASAVPAAVPTAPREDVSVLDVTAELTSELDDADCLEEATDGVQQDYLKAVHGRLQKEAKDMASRDLIHLLEENDWYLRAVRARKICEIVGIRSGEPSYYRDIYVWLPDVRWGVEAMPFCPACLSNKHVEFHVWRDNHFGRWICGLDTNYFTVSRRYKCLSCQKAAGFAKAAAKAQTAATDAAAAAQAVAAMADDDAVDEEGAEEAVAADEAAAGEAAADEAAAERLPEYTFMGWDQRTVSLLPYDYGLEFPAFLTHRAGLDLNVIDLMRPAFDGGVRAYQNRQPATSFYSHVDFVLMAALSVAARYTFQDDARAPHQKARQGSHQARELRA